MNNIINNNKNKRNVVANAGLDLNNRYCRACNIKLVLSPKEKGVYICPVCNVSTGLANTKPQEKLTVTFPWYDPNTSPDKKLVYQSSVERLSRSNYFINKQLQEKNKEEMNDPYLRQLKLNNSIKITNIEYYSMDDMDYYYKNE